MKPNLQLRIAPDADPEHAPMVLTAQVSPQPVPWYTQVLVSLDGGSTMITRHFRDGNHRRCTQCPRGRCVFDEMVGSCQIVASGRISVDEAKGFDANESVWRVPG